MKNRYLISGSLLVGALSLSTHALPTAQVTKSAAKSSHSVVKAPVKTVAEPIELTPAVLSPEQLAIGKRVLLGDIQCELAVHATMTPHAQLAGRFVLETGHTQYVLEPVVTSTGAVRLEETASGAVWLQLANKSMLMNQKLGKRLADECMNPDQLLVAKALESNPQPGLLDAPKDALVPIGAGGKVQELVPNPAPVPKLLAKAKTKKKSK